MLSIRCFAFGYGPYNCSNSIHMGHADCSQWRCFEKPFLVRLSFSKEMHIWLYCCKVMFGMASPTLQPLISKIFKDLPPSKFRDSLKNQIPLDKKNLRFVHFSESFQFIERIASCSQVFYWFFFFWITSWIFLLRLKTNLLASSLEQRPLHIATLQTAPGSQCPEPQQGHLSLIFMWCQWNQIASTS